MEPTLFTIGGADDCAGLESADLTYTARETGFSDLPDGIIFNADSRTFTFDQQDF